MDQTVRYLQNLNLPDDLQKRVRLWLNHTWEQQKTFDENAILDSLPIKMKGDVALSVHYHTLMKIQMFKDCEKAFLTDLVLKIRPILFLPGDFVCKKGEIGKEMYIVNKGHVQVLGGENSDIVLVTLTEGSVFGEISLLGIPGYDRRTANVRSQGFSYLFMLNKEDLWEALKTYPDVESALKKKAKPLIKENLERARAENAKSLLAESIIRDAPRRPSTPRLLKTVLQVVSPDSRCAQMLTGKQQGSKSNSPGSSQPSVRNSLSSSSSLPQNIGPILEHSPSEENYQNFLTPGSNSKPQQTLDSIGQQKHQNHFQKDTAINISEASAINTSILGSPNGTPTFPFTDDMARANELSVEDYDEESRSEYIASETTTVDYILPKSEIFAAEGEDKALASDFEVDDDWTSSVLSLNSLFRKSPVSREPSPSQPDCRSLASYETFSGYDNLTFLPNEAAGSRRSSFSSDMSI